MEFTRSGVTLAEIVVVLACIAVVAVMLLLTTAHDAAFARLFAARVAHARAVALVASSSVAVGRGSCDVADVWLEVPDGGAVKVTFPARGLVFTPDGLPRTCDGGGVGNTTILLEHRGHQAAVIVSSLGRVRWEKR